MARLSRLSKLMIGAGLLTATVAANADRFLSLQRRLFNQGR